MPRVAKPAALRLVEGRGSGRDSGGRKVVDAPAFKRVPPSAPGWLSDEAVAEWNRVVPELTRLDIVKAEDRAVLATYCETWSEFKAATLALQEHGSLTIEAKQGEIPHPAVAIRRNAGHRLQLLAREFGLTPSSEQSLAKESDDGEDDNPF
jgi:P27 family predicted phage terminase small subunit